MKLLEIYLLNKEEEVKEVNANDESYRSIPPQSMRYLRTRIKWPHHLHRQVNQPLSPT